ncbi:MAG: DotA/TraY family protein [Alphaproteobacteria bacterium]|nr:DotA/TraY family protein [Alphaproteobacteria bacterium]
MKSFFKIFSLKHRAASLALARGSAHGLSGASLKLLPFFFLAMLSFAPLNAQAAPPYTGTGPGTGMFDCLGELDWGCRVIGFLFQVNDNTVTYYKNGAPTAPEAQTPALKALRAMMEFFSNALLIIASIKLLFELVQMTAESAQTGQVGGKDTNKLWAPIRLVFAIGLLVPIPNEGGLNSGQLIVLQVAKWGSGMASQGWKVFTAKLAENDTLTVPPPPRVKDLAYTTFKIYACKGFINFYAAKLGMPDDIVRGDYVPDETSARYIFRNKINKDICGVIRYNVPLQQVGFNDEIDRIYIQYANSNRDDFISTEGQIATEVSNIIQPFLPSGRTLPRPRSEYLDSIINSFQQQVTDRVNNSNTQVKQAMTAITNKIQEAAGKQGWTSAGTYFLDITRAEGQLINGALSIPTAIGPNLDVFKNYPSAFAGYQELMTYLDTAARPQDGGATPTRASMTATSENQSFLDFLKTFVQNIVTDPAEEIFKFLDKAAVYVGLWDKDKLKAFGDLGASTNPFGEIAALGHKKIKLALNYVSYAILASGGGALLGGFGGVGKVLGAGIAALSALLMMIATLFFLAGVLLAYIVPMFPFTRFFFSILTWLGSLIEAMILVPFMALAFLTPKGEGFTGPNTRNAIFLIFQLFLRPILCLFGLMCAMVLFYVTAKFLNAAFYDAAGSVYKNEVGSAMQFMQKLVYSVMYVGLIYSAANISFKMIEHIPKHALRWMGGSASEESYDDHQGFMGIATAVGGGQLLNNLQNLPQNFLAPIQKSLEANASRKASNKANTQHNNMLAALNGNRGSNGTGSTSDNMPRGPGPRSPRGGAENQLVSHTDDAAAPHGAALDGDNTPTAHTQVAGGTGQQDATAGAVAGDGSSATRPVVAAQTFNQPIAPDAGRTTATIAAPASTTQQTVASSGVTQARIATVLASVRAMGDFASSAHESAARNAIEAHLRSNPNDEDGAIVAGHQARNSITSA